MKERRESIKKKGGAGDFFLTLSCRIVHSCISRVYSYIMYKIVHFVSLSLFCVTYFWVLN